MNNLFRINKENLSDFLNSIKNKNIIENSINNVIEKTVNLEQNNINENKKNDENITNKLLWQIGKSKVKINLNIKKNLSKSLSILYSINELFVDFINFYPNFSLKEIVNSNLNNSNNLFTGSNGFISLNNHNFQINLTNKNYGIYNIIDCGISTITNLNLNNDYEHTNNIPIFDNILSNPENINNIFKIINIINSNIQLPFDIDTQYLNTINLTNIIISNKDNLQETNRFKNDIFKSNDKYIFYIKSYTSYTKILFINKTDNLIYYAHIIEKTNDDKLCFYIYYYVVELDLKYKIKNYATKTT